MCPTSKVPSEGDITRQGMMQSSVIAFDLLGISVFDRPVQDSWGQPLGDAGMEPGLVLGRRWY